MNNMKNSSNKSFIPLINTLKFKKDKEENATPSYLLALGDNNNNNKNDYIQTGNIIEEEKSEMLISESDFSNKKNNGKKTNFLTIKEQLNYLNYEKSKNLNDKKLCDENKQKIFITVNKLKKKNNEKELKKREIMSNNKKNLLSIFFTLSKNKNEEKEKKDKLEKKNISIEKPKNRRTYSQGSSYVNSLKPKSRRKINSERIKYENKKLKCRTNNNSNSNISITRKTNPISFVNKVYGNNSFRLIPFSKKNLSFKVNNKKKKINEN